MLIIVFGLPGAGKTYVGKLLHKYTGFRFYDGDRDLTGAIKKAITTQSRITEKMRDTFFEQLFNKIEKELHKHNNLIVAQTFIKERFRKQAVRRFPNVKYLFVKAYPRVREQRIQTRAVMSLDKNYIKRMIRRFEKPEIEHQVIVNNKQGKEALLQQFKQLKLSG